MEPTEIEAEAAKFRDEYARLKTEIAKAIVGHDNVVTGVLTGIFTGGNCLLEGASGVTGEIRYRYLGALSSGTSIGRVSSL